MFLKQSTATTIVLGPFVDSSDGNTAETGLTIAQADVRLSKNAGAFAQKNESTSCTHMEIGHYSCLLNTTDTGTLGRLRVAVHESGALPVWVDFLVLPANVFDSLLSTDKLQVHVDEMTAGIITAAVIATDAVDADALADNAITAATFAADAITAAKLASDVTTELQNGLATAASIAALNNLSAAQVNAEVDTALADIHLDHLLATNYDPASKPGTSTALLNELVENDGGVSRFTANSLEQAPTGGSAPSAADIADAVWDEGLAAHNTLGSTGEALADAQAGGGGGSDPWETELPDAYDPGTAGYILGTYLDQMVSLTNQSPGAGAISFTYTLTELGSGDPIEGADVWATSDSGGSTVIASGQTDVSGEVTFMLDAGTVYIWRQKSGWNFTNPDTETIS